MNILYITISDLSDLNKRGIYTDLIGEFAKHGHHVSIVTPTERRKQESTRLVKHENHQVLHVRTGNLFRTNLLEKGISNLLIEWQYKKAIKQYFNGIKFDLVLYASPPVTFAKVIEFIKKRDGAVSYLMLKDIFPQNALDIGLLKKSGIKGLVYRFFKRKEKKFYSVSDYIGCMSQGNVKYLLKHNSEIAPERVDVCPNSVTPVEKLNVNREDICKKYGIPKDRILFIYGGNFGLPQGVDFIIQALRRCRDKKEVHFILCGSGTEFHKLKTFLDNEHPGNVTLIEKLPKNEYDRLAACCDVGLIFLDHRFTIPNFPSRLLSYMESGMPVLAATDPNTDIGEVITSGGFGCWCESNDVEGISKLVDSICASKDRISTMGRAAREYLEAHYTSEISYRVIMEKLGNSVKVGKVNSVRTEGVLHPE